MGKKHIQKAETAATVSSYRVRPYGPSKWDGVGWRQRSIFGALGLRPPLADVTEEEAMMMARHATGVPRVVEIGVYEGAVAALIGASATSELVLIDPYRPGRLLGLNMAGIVAARTVGRNVAVPVRWLRMESTKAAESWEDPIHFLRIDGIHSLEGVQRDWEDWASHVVAGGCAAVRADVGEGGAVDDVIVPWIEARGDGWALVERVDTTAILCHFAT